MWSWWAWVWGGGCVYVWASSIGTERVQAGERYLGCNIHVNTLVSRRNQPESGGGGAITADYCKRVLLSHLFDFDFGDMWVLCVKRCTRKSQKTKSKRWERRTRFPQSAIPMDLCALGGSVGGSTGFPRFNYVFFSTFLKSIKACPWQFLAPMRTYQYSATFKTMLKTSPLEVHYNPNFRSPDETDEAAGSITRLRFVWFSSNFVHRPPRKALEERVCHAPHFLQFFIFFQRFIMNR